MNRILTLAGVVLTVAALAACSPGIHTLDNSITFDSNGIVVHARGRPNANVSADGDLSIDGKAVAVTPAQHQLLRRYYRQARYTMDSGEAIGKQGVQIATHSIGAAIRSIFHGDSSGADKQLDSQSKQIESAADKLCADIKALGATQHAIAAEIPAFAPYASNDRLQCTVTHSITYKANGAKSSSFTYALREDGGAGHGETSPRQSTRSGAPSASTASLP
ncbi:MAG TPA: DUF2884 family protein [Rhodanobacteraceae bacterium]|nr:DUF2884 family protein [Rhodanobacteraceae bacterium]